MKKKRKERDVLNEVEKEIIKGILDKYNIIDSSAIYYYDFARELKVGKPVSPLIEKYVGKECERRILEGIAKVIRPDPYRRLSRRIKKLREKLLKEYG